MLLFLLRAGVYVAINNNVCVCVCVCVCLDGWVCARVGVGVGECVWVLRGTCVHTRNLILLVNIKAHKVLRSVCRQN